MLRRPTALLAVLILAGALTSGCSSDGSDDAATSDEATTSTTDGTTTTAAPEPLEDQAPPTKVNGVTVQGDVLWIASIADDVVLEVRREDGAILQRIPTEGAGPDDVAVAPDGSVWSTGFTGGQLGRIADGAYEVATTIEAGINPITIADDGTVWVGTYGPDGDLYRLDPDALEGASGAPTPLAAGTMPDINAFGLLPDGRLLAPAGGIGGPGSAIAIDPTTGAVETIVDGLPPVAAGTVDAEGTGYVLANVTGEVIRIDVEAGTSEVVRTVTEGAPFDNLAFADDGTLYLTSFVAPTVTEVAPDGTTRVIPIGAAG